MKFRIAEVEIPADEPFKFDALERKPVVEFLRDLIKQIEGPFVLALDSPWGTGKTTVVRMLRRSLEIEGFRCVYFNAWKDDYVTDPLIPMVSCIDELKPGSDEANDSFRSSMATVRKAVGPIAKRAIKAAIKVGTMGVLDVDEAIEEATADAASEAADDLIDAFQKEKASLEQFRDALEKAVGKLSENDPPRPLIFFIDELDRCRPSYAIELLERVKHLFDVPNMVFVLSIDKKQLEAITAAVYGERIDAPEYLRRFIDLEYALPALHTKSYTRALIERFEFKEFFDARKQHSTLAYDHDNFVEAFTLLAGLFELPLRARERCLTRLAVALTQTGSKQYLDPIVLSLLLVLRTKAPALYAGLIGGSITPRDLMETLRKMPMAREFAASRYSTILEAYLIAGDVVRERGEQVLKELQDLAIAAPGTASGLCARDVLDMQRHIQGSRSRDFSIKYVSNKVDLAAKVGDDW
jgi:KAP family P-loop domain